MTTRISLEEKNRRLRENLERATTEFDQEKKKWYEENGRLKIKINNSYSEITHLKESLKHKEEIIYEQREQINSLVRSIEIINMKENVPVQVSVKIPSSYTEERYNKALELIGILYTKIKQMTHESK